MKNIIKHSVIKNSIFLFIIKFVEIGLPLILLPFLSRNLGVIEFGLYFIIVSILSIGYMITDFGFSISAVYKIVNNKNNKCYIAEYISSIFIIKTALSIIVIIGVIIYLFNSGYNSINLLSYFLISTIIIFQSYQMPWFFQGIEKMKNITIAVVTTKLTNFLSILLLLYFWDDFNSILISFSINGFICSYIYLYLYKKSGFYFQLPKSSTMIINEAKESFSFFLSKIAITLSSSLNSIVIGKFLGLNITALYGSAEKLYNGSINMMSPITNALYPYFARNKKVSLLVYLSVFFTSIAIILSFTAYLNSEKIIIIIFGYKYIEAATYLNLFLILIPINVLSSLWSYPAFSIINKTSIANFTVLISSFIYLLILIYLYIANSITVDNIIGSIIITDSITLLTRLIYFRKLYKKNHD
ncbi:oligosaccharide flippase family protein [Proteus mirabilis]|uniref:oligosaccharide flippase family protein n=1 Tax=Proteus mirabilis TaxID=584 RepID=UPI00106FC0E6|nr:oligosaccharide flippase family protein [Proteus mirabilis]EMA4723209.1 oligosaccharide flippase family protein [Proteus mirabilis]MCT8260140.1 oligosaccharide flippase family protein [Proteus mirabilis]MDF7460244.1 oligosaccharide flippase family protein [Proteus mirabilis]MDM3623309.1 oligosaccharide flippase family protein [Proteus mirabilis]HAT5577560.1 oligosaccharide flippase family protein [Proteus mirabilis]